MVNYQVYLSKKFKNKSVKIGIVGLGYVGLPLLLKFSEVGYSVIGFDIDRDKISKLQNGKSYISHISSSSIKNLINDNIIITSDFSKVSKVDVLIICLPTPLNKYREPDLSFIVNSMNILLPFLKKGQALSLESTTYPGTTEEKLLPLIKSTGMVVGKNFFLIYSPEREDPGNKNYTLNNIPKIVSGHTKVCLKIGKLIYNSIVKTVVPVSNTKTAEITKLLENIYRAVNIGLVNEMKIITDRMGINIHEVIKAASTKPFGFTPFYPGPGLGGHCIPIDPFYLTWKAREFGLSARFIELAGEINTQMPYWVIEKAVEALNSKKQSLKGSKILVLGISYKKNIDDMRESPAVVLMDLLRKKGALVDYTDPYVPIFPKLRKFKFNLSSIKISPKMIKKYDLLLLTTDHDKFDYNMIQRHGKLIIDTRGVFQKKLSNVIRA
jgi:UDP-N-acetyl-D-glucosamine dehydrogenase